MITSYILYFYYCINFIYCQYFLINLSYFFLLLLLFLFMGNIRFLFCLKNYRGIYYIIMVFLIAKEQTARAEKGEDKARSVFETKR